MYFPTHTPSYRVIIPRCLEEAAARVMAAKISLSSMITDYCPSAAQVRRVCGRLRAGQLLSVGVASRKMGDG